MSQEFLKTSIKPITDEYITRLLKLEDDLSKRGKALERELLKVADQYKGLKEQEKNNKTALKIDQDKLSDEIGKSRDLQSKLREEITESNRLNNEIQKEKTKTNEALQCAKDERDLTTKERGRQEAKTREWENKISLLATDFAKLKQGNTDIDERIRKAKTRENVVTKREEASILKEREVSIREVTCTSREERIKFEYRKLKLKND